MQIKLLKIPKFKSRNNSLGLNQKFYQKTSFSKFKENMKVRKKLSKKKLNIKLMRSQIKKLKGMKKLNFTPQHKCLKNNFTP